MDSFAAILNFVWVSTSWLSLAVVNGAPRVLVNGSSTIGPTTANNTIPKLDVTKPMLSNIKGIGIRAISVVTAVSAVVVLYFVIRAICSRRRNNRTRRYGILNTDSRDNMEMKPLSEQDDDDDDDLTLFDMSKRKGKG